MTLTKETLETGLDQSQRVLDGQFSSLNSIQTKVGVLLGFDVTTLGLIYALGLSWVHSHKLLAGAATVSLIASMAIFAYSLAIRGYQTVPKMAWLARTLNSGGVGDLSLKSLLVSQYVAAVTQNKLTFSRKFYMVNTGLILMVLGIAIYAIGGLVT